MTKPRNPYEEDVDFSVLALQDAEFAKHLKHNGQLDFSNAQSVKQLTKSLLKRDFGLKVELPDDRLCPPVPNRQASSSKTLLSILIPSRLNYILWLQDLLDTTSPTFTERYDPNRDVVGLDIGTGSSSIYPLLGCATRPRWRFLATDIDPTNLTHARANIALNGLQPRIKLIPSTPGAPLIPLDSLGIDSIDFTLTNPPFHPTLSSLLASAASKHRPPLSACTGAEVEMVVAGGEVAFVARIVAESLALKTRVQWYSSMLGKLASVKEVVDMLREKGVRNWAVREFVQGGKTRRWGVAWSFGGRRPAVQVARGVGGGSGVEKGVLPFPSEFEFEVVGAGEKGEVGKRVDGLMGRLDLRWMWRGEKGQGVGFAAGDVWSRKARRKREKEMEVDGGKKRGVGEGDGMDVDGSSGDEEEPALGVKITVRDAERGEEVQVDVRWLVGMDSVLFESFCGMLKRELSKPAG